MNPELKHKLLEAWDDPFAADAEKLARIRELLLQEQPEAGEPVYSRKLSELHTEYLEQSLKPELYGHAYLSGYPDLDALCGGFMPGELLVIGGRPGMGKTQLMVNLALNFAEQTPVLYITLDASAGMLTQRILAAMSAIETKKIRTHTYTAEEKNKLFYLREALEKKQLHICEDLPPDARRLYAFCKEQIETHGIGLIVIDYLQLLRFPGYRNKDQELSAIMWELKTICRELKICLLAGSQLSRGPELRGGEKMPEIWDLRSSGSIEQDADKIILIHRMEYYRMFRSLELGPRNCMDVLLAKNRNGNIGEIRLNYNDAMTTFYHFDPEAEELEINPERPDKMPRNK